MSYVVMARRYRPRKFSEVVGQENISQTLQNAISSDRIGHAYLFSGPRGVGKTSMARIFSKALNCEKGPVSEPCQKCDICRLIDEGSDLDVVEIDAASNTGVDNIRELRNNAAHSTSRARYRIYIIDEIHMLSKGAFNALLKTLEEPPPHVKFIFATTEPNKVPVTVQSRCQRFDFRRISVPDIVRRLRQILEEEKVAIEDEALKLLARQSNGGMRDAQVSLDQLIAFKAGGENAIISLDDVKQFFGATGGEVVVQIAAAVGRGDVSSALSLVDGVVREGASLQDFVLALVNHFRGILIFKTCGPGSSILAEEGLDESVLSDQAGLFTTDGLAYAIQILSNTRSALKDASLSRIPLEIAVVKICGSKDLLNLREVLSYLKGTSGKISITGAAPVADNSPPVKKAVTPVKAVATETETPVDPISEERQPAEPEPEQLRVPSKAADQTNLTTEDVKARWPELLKAVREENSFIYGLINGARVVELKGDDVVLGFDRLLNSFHQEMLSEYERRKVVEQQLYAVFGRQLGMQMIQVEGAEESSEEKRVYEEPSDSPDEKAKKAKREEENEVMFDPAVRKVLEAFDGRLISVQKKRGS